MSKTLNSKGVEAGIDAVFQYADGDARQIAEAVITAYLGAVPESPSDLSVGLKPLEWIENQSWKHAKTPFGAIYTARPCLATNFLGKWLLSLEIERIGPLHDSENAAKAAAQADYEARIRAALTATADTQNPLSSTNGEIGETSQAPTERMTGKATQNTSNPSNTDSDDSVNGLQITPVKVARSACVAITAEGTEANTCGQSQTEVGNASSSISAEVEG